MDRHEQNREKCLAHLVKNLAAWPKRSEHPPFIEEVDRLGRSWCPLDDAWVLKCEVTGNRITEKDFLLAKQLSHAESQLLSAVNNSDVMNAIAVSTEAFLAQVIVHVEANCGKLTEAQASVLHSKLGKWLDRATEAETFEMSDS